MAKYRRFFIWMLLFLISSVHPLWGQTGQLEDKEAGTAILSAAKAQLVGASEKVPGTAPSGRDTDRDIEEEGKTSFPEQKNLSERKRGFYDEVSAEQAKDVNTDLSSFGYDFFRKGTGASPDSLALVGPDYVVGPGDVLKIDLWGTIEGNYLVEVDRNGEVVLPKLGVVTLWGQTFAEAKEAIRTQIRKYYNNFELNVTMGALRSIQVYLVGEVERPGAYQISSVSTLLSALDQSGGPSRNGSLRDVQLLRNGEVLARFDLYDFFLRGDKSGDVRLQSGDTIFVPVIGPLAGVAGNVKRPAIYELKGVETLRDVLALAGGIATTGYLQKVQVERVVAHDKKTVVDLDLAAAEGSESELVNFAIQDRDMIKVSPIALIGGYVTLAGHVKRPDQYQHVEGMRVADLLIPYDNLLLPEWFPEKAQIVRTLPPEYRPELLTINLRLALEKNPQHNIPLVEYDELRIFSRAEMEELPMVKVSGAVLSPGDYRLYDKMTVRDLVVSAGNLKRRALLSQAELSRFVTSDRETTIERFLFDLKKALDGDPAHNLQLFPDDHLFIRNIPDFAENEIVKIEGEVLYPGSYVISKGETLSSLLQRAGGYTERAYLRGGVMTRESVRELQRANLEKLIVEQEEAISKASLDMVSGAMSSEEIAAAEAILESRKTMVEKLRKAPVTGRIVVKFLPLEEISGTEFDIPLMAGDTITIPQSPGSVAVMGEVYNPISLIYSPNETVSYYLDLVGGLRDTADKDAVFLVRADGTVLSKEQAGLGIRWNSAGFRWDFGGFNTTELYAGDTILVPEKVEKSAIMRDVKDISTILYQMALGAAAVASF